MARALPAQPTSPVSSSERMCDERCSSGKDQTKEKDEKESRFLDDSNRRTVFSTPSQRQHVGGGAREAVRQTLSSDFGRCGWRYNPKRFHCGIRWRRLCLCNK